MCVYTLYIYIVYILYTFPRHLSIFQNSCSHRNKAEVIIHQIRISGWKLHARKILTVIP